MYEVQRKPAGNISSKRDVPWAKYARLSKTLCPSQIQEASCLRHILGHLLPELGKTVSMNLPSAHMLGSSVFTLVEYLLDDEGFRFLRVVSVPENALKGAAVPLYVTKASRPGETWAKPRNDGKDLTSASRGLQTLPVRVPIREASY